MNLNSNLDEKFTGSARISDAKVLLVEDVIGNQQVITLLLKKIGVAVEVASNGAEAVKKLETENYDLVFMDCHMPLMDGYQATQEIRARSEGFGHDIPIIALTASILVEDRERCLISGMNDYLPKPVSKEGLEKMMKKWLLTGPTSLRERRQKVLRDRPQKSKDSSIQPSIDWSIIQGLKELDSEGDVPLLTEMLQLFEKNFPRHLDDFSVALHSGDRQKVKAELHALKSSTCYLGAIGIARICEHARESLDRGNAESILDVKSQLQAEYLKILQILKRS